MKSVSLFFTFSLLFCKLFAHPFSECSGAPWGADSDLLKKKTAHTKQKENPALPSVVPAPLAPLALLSKSEKSESAYCKEEKSESKKLTAGQKSCRAMIRFFQVYISPIDGPRSSFYPTSSQYALEAIQKHGVFKGIAMGCDRLMRENGEIWVYDRTDRFGPERKLDPVQ